VLAACSPRVLLSHREVLQGALRAVQLLGADSGEMGVAKRGRNRHI